MGEGPTRDLHNGGSCAERVLAELVAIRQEISPQSVRLLPLGERMTSLEEKVDARLRKTRPIWEGVRQRLTEIESSFS